MTLEEPPQVSHRPQILALAADLSQKEREATERLESKKKKAKKMSKLPSRLCNSSIHALIADDDASTRGIIRAVLHKMNILHIIEADNGESAIHAIETHPIDILLCDWHMPKKTGLEVVYYLRLRLCHANLPVLMITSENHQDRILEAVDAGVTSYLVKPFRPKCLAKHVRDSLNN